MPDQHNPMKLNLITVIFILLGFSAWCQSRNTISFVVAPTHTIITTTGTARVGENVTSHFIIQSGTLFGVTYDHRIVAGLSVEGGVFFVSEKAQYEYSSDNISGIDNHYVPNGHVDMVLVQCIVKYTVFKYFFAGAGLGTDAQTGQNQANVLPDQSGLGLEAGFGAKVNAGHFVFSVNPFWRLHWIPVIFNSSWNHELDESGVKFGMGYNF